MKTKSIIFLTFILCMFLYTGKVRSQEVYRANLSFCNASFDDFETDNDARDCFNLYQGIVRYVQIQNLQLIQYSHLDLNGKSQSLHSQNNEIILPAD